MPAIRNNQPESEELELADTEQVEISDKALRLSTLPIVQLDMMLSKTAGSLENVRIKLEDAERIYERKTQRRNFASDEGHRASFREHAGPLIAAEDHLKEAADAAYELARNTGNATANDKEPVLSDEDAQRANARREFVKEDCAEPTLPALIKQAKQAIAQGDVANLMAVCALRLPAVSIRNASPGRWLSAAAAGFGYSAEEHKCPVNRRARPEDQQGNRKLRKRARAFQKGLEAAKRESRIEKQKGRSDLLSDRQKRGLTDARKPSVRYFSSIRISARLAAALFLPLYAFKQFGHRYFKLFCD